MKDYCIHLLRGGLADGFLHLPLGRRTAWEARSSCSIESSADAVWVQTACWYEWLLVH